MDSRDIRTFCIIAHIDHGKTTLTDRLLEATGSVAERDRMDRMMDSNPIERERGITIKLAPVTMQYGKYTLNLIDTPGHVDFGYEVSRSLAACEGVLLVVDATQGVQAQTLSNYEKASKLGLKIIPVLNKIDLPASEPERVTLELMELFGFSEEEVIPVSAKTGLNMDKLLEAIVKFIPAPKGELEKPPRALVFTSQFDVHKGVIAYIRMIDGSLKDGEMLHMMGTQVEFESIEMGHFLPKMSPGKTLSVGEVGYVCTGLKSVKEVNVGDTMTSAAAAARVVPLADYQPPQPMVFMELYPIDGDDFVMLLDAMQKLAMHDAALAFQSTSSPALGNGLRVGFLGILHAEIVRERLTREFQLELIATSPSVPYHVRLRNGENIEVNVPSQLPDPSQIAEISEPMTLSTIFTPREYIGAVMQLTEDHRGLLLSVQDMGTRVKMTYRLPLAELIIQFHDQLKSASSGFASLEYTLAEYQPVDAVKLSIQVHHEDVPPLASIVVKDKAEQFARSLVSRLKDVIPRQQFEIPIQGMIGGKVIARETVKAFRKDVTAKLYGGDATRRMKLLRKQARGKKRMKSIGKVDLPQEAFLAVLSK
jgi:GTP-binding protein LepA